MNDIKTLNITALIFTILTICGAIYVIASRGEASPGYAVIPMTFSLFFSSMVHGKKKKAKKSNHVK